MPNYHIEAAMDNADAGTWAGFSVSQGVLHAQQGRYAVAEELLTGSLAFYSAAGDELSVCAIRCHLAWLHLQQRQREKAKAYLAPALAWLQTRNAAYFPHWWSPTIMADLCLYAVEHLPAAQCVVRNMCVEHLSAHVRTPLTGLLSAGDPPVRARAGRILDRIEGERYAELAWVKRPAVRRVLCDLLDRGTLQRETLPELFDLLVTAEQRRTWNPTVVAVFGLYIEDCSRKEIQAQLDCSAEVVRRAINHVFNVFHVDAARLPNTLERRTVARKEAKKIRLI